MLDENDAVKSDKSVRNVEDRNTGDMNDPDPEPIVRSRPTTPMYMSSTGTYVLREGKEKGLRGK